VGAPRSLHGAVGPADSATRVRAVAGAPDFLALAAAHPAIFPCLLESVAEAPATGRWDILFVGSGEALVGAAGDREPFLARLDRLLAGRAAAEPAPALPFRGGWVLMLGYELAAECEPKLRLPPPPGAWPRALALRSPAALLRDRRDGRVLAVAEPGHEHWLAELAALAASAPPAVVPARAGLAPLEDPPARFLGGVAAVHEYLRAGDVFQVNLSRGWQVAQPAGLDVAALYAALRRANPAPFAGLFRHQGLAVLSSSPERLVAVRGRRVETRPIAGTRPRAATGELDAARVRELLAHPKERAEHVMLIDLERNDLGRVCVPGSVVVDELMTVESYAHVHHIVSNVHGTRLAGANAGQVIRAVFPGGTITGCPKVRCMEIIAELEGGGRGPYTGALGYVNHDGDMDLNILIRTLSLDGRTIRLRAGAGIVADSDAARELEETRSKAEGLLRALRGDYA
jgi:anthranilate synthase component 1